MSFWRIKNKCIVCLCLTLKLCSNPLAFMRLPLVVWEVILDFFYRKEKKFVFEELGDFFHRHFFFYTFFFFFLTKENLRFKDFGGEFSEITSTDRKTHQNRSKTTKNMKKSIFVKKKKKISKKIPPAAGQLFSIFFFTPSPKGQIESLNHGYWGTWSWNLCKENEISVRFAHQNENKFHWKIWKLISPSNPPPPGDCQKKFLSNKVNFIWACPGHPPTRPSDHGPL